MNLMKEAMNELDEELVEELSGQLKAEEGGKDKPADVSPKRPARRLKWVLPVAACLLLGAGILTAMKGGLFRRDYSAVWKQQENTAAQEMIYSAYRTRIRDEAWGAYRITRICPEEKVGEKLADVTVEGAWVEYETGAGILDVPVNETAREEPELLPAEIYAIRGISRDVAVCLHFPEKSGALTTDRYYTYLNSAASFDSLAALREALAADADLTVTVPDQMPGARIAETDGKDLNYINFDLTQEGAAGIRKALLAAEGALLPEAEPEEQLKTCRRMGSFSVLINGLISARVTVWDSGCLIIRPTASDASLNAPFTYMIGEKAAGEILKTIEDSGSVNQSETVTWVTVPAK